MPLVRIRRADINYEIVGHDGPWAAFISSGRLELADAEGVARGVAQRGYRVVIHDRRNCGRSSLDFNTVEPEDDVWADDLAALLVHLGAVPAIVGGKSRGTRVAIRLALRHPRVVRGLFLWGLGGSPAVGRYLDDYYYGKYVRAAQEGGMEAVCGLDHFAGLIAAQPGSHELLLAIDPAKFIETMQRWRAAFLSGVEQPVMGISDDELGSIAVPTAIAPYYDRMHPYQTAVYACQVIPDCRFLDFDPARRSSPETSLASHARDEAVVAAILCDFAESLPAVARHPALHQVRAHLAWARHRLLQW